MGVNPPTLNPFALPGILAQAGRGPAREAAGTAPAQPAQPAATDAAEGTPAAGSGGAPLQCSALLSCHSLPWTAAQFRQEAASRISEQTGNMGEAYRQIREAQARVGHPNPGVVDNALHQIATYRGQIAEFNLISWLAKRDYGTPQAISVLMSSLNRVGGGANNRLQWQAQIAMILASELEDPDAEAALVSLIGNSNSWQSARGPQRERLALELVYERLLTAQSGTTRQPRDELSLLVGENRLRLALIAKDQGRDADFRTLLTEARTYVSRLATTANLATTSHAGLLDATDNDQITDRRPYIRNSIESHAGNNYALLRHEFAWANALLANIISQEAESAGSQQEELSRLRQAERYLRNTATLRGLPMVEARRALAANLVQQGYLLNDLEQANSAEFGEALCLLNNIIAWADTYQNTPGVTTVPRWLVNITVSARISRAKLRQVLVGEIEMQIPPDALCLLAPEDPAQPRPGELTSQELQELQQGGCENRVLEIQSRLLESLAPEFTSVLGTQYQYGANPVFDVLNDQQKMNLSLALGENFARRGFINMELGNDPDALMSQARQQLEPIIQPNSAATPLSRAIAHMWLAKIMVAEIGEDPSYQTNSPGLTQALEHIAAALSSDKLRGRLLTSARQTRYEILLWQIELQLREGESYSPRHISELETLVFEIFGSDQASEELISRALKDLMEAYSTRQSNYQLIIILSNLLLGRNFTPPQDSELASLVTAITGLRDRLSANSQLNLPDEFRALLYLRLAEAVSWGGRGQLDDADQILDELQQTLPAEIAEQTGARQIRILDLLLRAEIQMRRSESANPVTAPDLVRAVLTSREVDLVTRLTFDQVEGLQYEGRGQFPALIQLLRDLLSPRRLSEIQQLFGPNRGTSYLRYRFRLRLELGKVLGWNRDYQEAVAELSDLLQDPELTSLQNADRALADLIRTQGRVNLGDMLRYDWDGRDLAAARNNYQTVLDGHQNLDDNTAPAMLVAIATAHLGLAELDRLPRDLEAAANHYTAVREIAGRLADVPDKYHELLARAFLGMAQLAREGSGWLQNNLEQAAQHVASARDHLRLIEDPPAELENAIDQLANDPNIRPRIRPELTFGLQRLGGADGRTETQINLGGHTILHPDMAWLHLTLNEQIDLGPEGNLYSTYAGARFLPHSNFTFDLSFRLATTGDEGASMLLFWREDLRASFFLYEPWLTVGGEADINFSNPELNSYRGSFVFNPMGFTDQSVLRVLGPGIQAGSYPFYYDGLDQRINTLPFGVNLELQPTDWLSLRGNLSAMPYMIDDANPETEDHWQWGLQTGAGLGVNFWRMRLGADFWYQLTKEYPIGSVQGNAAISF